MTTTAETAARRGGIDEPIALVRPASMDTPEIAALLLTLVAAVDLIASLAVSTLRLDGFGLAGSVPISYSLGLVCLPVASALLWSRRKSSTVLIVAGLVVFVLVVWLTPYVLEGTPRFRTSYLTWGYVDPILRGDGLMPARFVYHNWPIFPMLIAGIASVSGASALTIMGWFPAIAMLAYLGVLGALLWLVARPIRDRMPNAWAAGLWLLVVFDWTGQDYFSPQALAYVLFLAWTLLMAHVVINRGGRLTAAQMLVAIGLYVLVVLTHVLTAMNILGALVALSVFGLVRRPSLVVTYALIFIGWQAYGATPFFSFYGTQIQSALLAADDFLQRNLANRIAGSPDHETVAAIRVVAAVVVFGLGGVAVARLGLPRSWPIEVRFAVSILIAIAVLAPISVYGGEMLIRVLLFSLPLLAIIVVRTLDARLIQVAALASLAVFAPLQLVTHYGNELYDYVSPGEVAGFEYVAERLAPANVYGGFPAAGFENSASLDWRNALQAAATQPLALTQYDQPQNRSWLHKYWPVYVAVSRGDAAAAELFYDDPTFVSRVLARLSSDRNFTLVFRDPDISIYRWLGPPPGAVAK